MVYFDPFDFDIQQNPYPVYEELRNESPIYYVEKHDLWVLSRYSDIHSVVNDWQTYSNREGVDIDKTDSLLAPDNVDEKDGAEHDKYRRLIQKWFTPRTLRDELLDPLKKETSHLVSEFAAQGGGDIVQSVAWQLPAFVITRMFDAPEDDRADLISFMKPVFARIPNDPVPPKEAFESGRLITNWCNDLIEKRRGEKLAGRNDILSMLLQSNLDGNPLTDEQVLGIISHLIVASSGTTQDLIANAVWLLAEHPAERSKLIAAPEMIPNALEECLRFEAVVQSVSRVSNVDIMHHGAVIPQGATVVNLLGSANRDERHWDDPKRFDVSRKPNGYLSHLSFADGIHRCIGAPVARLEAKIVVEELLEKMPEFELTSPPVRAVSHVARGIEHLYIGTGK